MGVLIFFRLNMKSQTIHRHQTKYATLNKHVIQGDVFKAPIRKSCGW